MPGGIHNLVTPPGKANAPRILKPAEGDFFAEVRVPGDVRPAEPPAPGSSVAFSGAGMVLWADATNFLRLESAGVSRGGQASPYVLFEHHRAGMPPMEMNAPFKGGPVWLRMERRGNQVVAYYNTDGTNWILLKTLDFPAPRAMIGVEAVNTSSAPFTARFDSYRVGKP